jgi:hypothetical protein
VDDVDVIVGLTEALVSIAAPGFAIAQKASSTSGQTYRTLNRP